MIYETLQLTSSFGDGCNDPTGATVSHFIMSCEVGMICGSAVQQLQNVRSPVSIQLNLLPVTMVSLVTEHVPCAKIRNLNLTDSDNSVIQYFSH